MAVVDRGQAEEHEDDRLRGAAQHLHGVLHRRVGLVRDVRLHVVLHRDPAERDPAKDKAISQAPKDISLMNIGRLLGKGPPKLKISYVELDIFRTTNSF